MRTAIRVLAGGALFAFALILSAGTGLAASHCDSTYSTCLSQCGRLYGGDEDACRANCDRGYQACLRQGEPRCLRECQWGYIEGGTRCKVCATVCDGEIMDREIVECEP